jgi:beta-lactamase regulating signal transducer with metallopeptidase domain
MIALLECTAVMSALTLVYMVLNRMLAKRYAEKWRYYAWLIIVVGLIIPFRPQLGNAAIKVDVPERLELPVFDDSYWLRYNPYGPFYEYMVGLENNAAASSEVDGAPEPTENIAPSVSAAQKFDISAMAINILSVISWWDAAAIVWGCGVVAFIVYQIMKHRRFMKMTNRWRERVEDEKTLELFRELKKEMKINRQIEMHMCPFAASPMLVGFVRPRILLPETDFAQDELRLVIKHELVHFKRMDVLYRFLLLIATAVHWFNPVVHLLARSVDMGCEVSCDDEVVKGESLETRRRYSNTIIGVVKHQTKLKTILSTHLNGGKKTMKKRLSSIMEVGRKRGGVIIASIIVIAVLGTG